ncbi:ScaI family restriction endonuclease [Coleofasciculus sp. FACHB-64]|uniref:ScaI family restriction endonuclease n=1 Tax=Cyanophyceae TaxID=3028117 RepID=UPI001683DF7B|nr:ScaI family restriction endonuclease [Coleofasciculus sp. FACHB-64]MBD2044493.1 ScaI family restriction endonuclease [Coleofasciculus sp. FACHB-64]
MNNSPYEGLLVQEWQAKTLELIDQHPLDPNEIYEVVIQVWSEIFQSSITSRGYKIGVDFFPSPQVLGSFLHDLIPLEFAYRYPQIWRIQSNKYEKDLVYVPDDYFSIEIKTSSSKRNTYGDRSYTQKSSTVNPGTKTKSGYYLVINFQKLIISLLNPQINLVRFGWLDLDDWKGQKSQTGQQANLRPEVERYKLLKIPLQT